MFENVTYEFYTDTLRRAVVPDKETFDALATENKLILQRMYADGFLTEKVENGIDSAACMMSEVDYETEQAAQGGANVITSESIGGYSYSASATAADKTAELNAKSADAKKYKWITLYCDVWAGFWA